MDKLGQQLIEDRESVREKRRHADELEREVRELRRQADEIERLADLRRLYSRSAA